uniref:Cytochrome c oxidase subunit 8 n=1 Tax=Myotis myotis TaxID=51298 RepID=A0A7J7RH54_MYOMY|nr:hypothetical protein mMyoMyo1_010320 [Myotis myotis]
MFARRAAGTPAPALLGAGCLSQQPPPGAQPARGPEAGVAQASNRAAPCHARAVPRGQRSSGDTWQLSQKCQSQSSQVSWLPAEVTLSRAALPAAALRSGSPCGGRARGCGLRLAPGHLPAKPWDRRGSCGFPSSYKKPGPASGGQSEGQDAQDPELRARPSSMRLGPAIRLLHAPLRACVVPKAHISAKPAKTPTSAPEQAVALVVTFLSFMVPAGWVLSHLDSYKSRSAE